MLGNRLVPAGSWRTAAVLGNRWSIVSAPTRGRTGGRHLARQCGRTTARERGRGGGRERGKGILEEMGSRRRRIGRGRCALDKFSEREACSARRSSRLARSLSLSLFHLHSRVRSETPKGVVPRFAHADQRIGPGRAWSLNFS